MEKIRKEKNDNIYGYNALDRKIISCIETGINAEMSFATLENASGVTQVRKGQVREGLTALFNTSNYVLTILSESMCLEAKRVFFYPNIVISLIFLKIKFSPHNLNSKKNCVKKKSSILLFNFN